MAALALHGNFASMEFAAMPQTPKLTAAGGQQGCVNQFTTPPPKGQYPMGIQQFMVYFVLIRV